MKSARFSITPPATGKEAMQSNLLRPRSHRLRGFLQSIDGFSLASGIVVGLYALTLVFQFTATFGTSQTVVTAVMIAIALGLSVGARGSASNKGGRRDRSTALGVTHFGLAAWMVMFEWLILRLTFLTGRVPVTTLSDPATALLFVTFLAILALSLPAFGIAVIASLLGTGPIGDPRQSSNQPSLQRRVSAGVGQYLSGIVFGMLFHAYVIAPIAGVHIGGILAAISGAILFLACLALRQHADDVNPSQQVGGTIEEPRTETAKRTILGGLRYQLDRTWTMLVVLALGASLALLIRAMHQLLPGTSFLMSTAWAAVVAGLVLGPLLIEGRCRHSEDRSAPLAGLCLFAATCSSIVLLSFPILIDCELLLNAHVSQVWLAMGARGLLATLFCLPVGIAWGSVWALSQQKPLSRAHPFNDNPNRSEAFLCSARGDFSRLHPLAFAAGYCSIGYFGLSHFLTNDLIVITVWVLACLGLVQFALHPQMPRGWVNRGAIAAAACLIVAAGPLRDRFDPSRSARLLFATDVFVARQAGMAPEFFTVLNEGRNVALIEGEKGTYSVWKYRGSQLQLREDGVPKAVVSTDTRICPQFSAELLQAVFPLTLHDQPQDVLILGAGGGVSLTTCLSFPVQHVTLAEADSGLLELLESVIWRSAGAQPLSDDRVRLLRVDPVLAVVGQDRPYDAIISSPDHLMLAQSSPYATVEFFRQTAAKLTEDGIFCQRFQQVDFGASPLQAVVRTMRAAFSCVAAIETAPGELALLGSNSPQGLARKDLVKRLSRSHVRISLAELGWDWSVPLNLPAYDDDVLAKLSEAGTAGLNCVANGRFAFQLPQEVMRWGPKQQELLACMSQHAGRLLVWDHVDGNDPALLRRLSEVAGQRKLMSAKSYTDRKWAYRKSVREQLTERPRSVIQQVSGGESRRRLHPEDRRRKNYLAALGAAAKEKHPDPDAVRRVADYEIPYDPLLSYFVHREAAELYSQTRPRDVRSELNHRLHLAYYADARDRSIRNVITALGLLCEHADSVPQPQERFDHINALYQVLRARWQVRGTDQPKSTRIALNDIERTISALEASFPVMESLNRDLGSSEATWQSRQRYLDMTLVRPLRTFRSRLLPHHLRRERKRAELERGSEP